MKKVKLIVTTLLLVFALCIPAYAQTTSTRVAKSQDQVEKLLSNKKVKTIQIKTTKKTTITIPKGTYKKKIVINSPKASIVNNGKFINVTVQNATKYVEKAKGNTINVKDNKLKLGIVKNAIINHLVVFKESADLQIVCKGNIKKYTVKTTMPVKEISISDDSESDKTAINTGDIEKDEESNTDSYPYYNWNYWTPTVIPQITDNNVDNYTIGISDVPSVIQTNSKEIIYYELKNNSDKLDDLPVGYRINTIATGCAITASSFGSISISANPYADIAELYIELLDSNNTVITSKTISIEIETFSLLKLNNGYQVKFSYWANANSFNTYKGHNHYAWISNVEDENTQIECTNWQVAIVNNSENQNDDSLVWTDLTDSTFITGTLDEKYYSNAYKLNFAENGRYYIRAKYNDSYVYSPIISVSDMKDTNKFQDVEFDDQTYNVCVAQSTRNVVSFQIVDCTPEEVEELFSNVTYIKYVMVGTQYRGLGVSYDYATLGSHCMVYYNYNMEAAYNNQGQISFKRYYENNKLTVTEQYTNEVLKLRTVITYDDQWRDHTKISTYYDESGNITSKIGYYYTYDEDGKKTIHNGFLDE